MDKVEDEIDESWLYGNSEQPEGEIQNEEAEKQSADELQVPGEETSEQPEEVIENNGEQHLDESSQMEDSMHEAFHDEVDETEVAEKKEGEEEDELDDDSDDDDINIVIGDIKSGPSYNLKRGQAAAAANASGKAATGKFNIEDFESVGMIGGVPAHEFSIDSLEDKPWRKPGADITDYFNYGFTEDTWRAYCERQKRFRLNESGVGLAGLSSNVNQPIPQNGGMKRMQPMRRGIDVLGGGRSDGMRPQTKENVIQVMTADRREYSRMNRSFDLNEAGGEPNFFEESQFDYMNYEPTQDSQWQGNPGAWGPTGVKELTPGIPNMNMPPPGMGPMMVPPGGPMMGMGPMGMPPNMGPPIMGMHGNMNQGSQRMDRGRGDRFERERLDGRRRRSRSRSKERQRSQRRSRSRDRSRRPRSRSRERSRRPRSKSRERRRSTSRTIERTSVTRDRAERRSKSRDKKSKSRDRDRKTRDRERSVKPDKDEKPEKSENKDRDHKKEKKKKKDKEKSDDD